LLIINIADMPKIYSFVDNNLENQDLKTSRSIKNYFVLSNKFINHISVLNN